MSASESDSGASKGTKTPGVGKLYPIVREDEVEPLNRSSPAYNAADAPEAIPLRRFDEPAAPDVQPAELETPIEPAAILTADQVRDPIYHARQSLLFDDGHQEPRPARLRMTATDISRHGRQVLARVRAAGARLPPRGVTVGRADARKRALILACVAVVLGLGAITVYDSLSASGSHASLSEIPKASAHSTLDHAATPDSAFVTRNGSRLTRVRRVGEAKDMQDAAVSQRQGGRAALQSKRARMRTAHRAAGRKHPRAVPVRSAPATRYTPPVSTAATGSSAGYTPVSTAADSPAMSSSTGSTNPPAWGQGGVLGAGHGG